MSAHPHVLGIDIGGTGIKGAVVDPTAGELVGKRVKVATPPGGEPDAITSAVTEMAAVLYDEHHYDAVGVCFPAIVHDGRTMSAVNVSPKWLGLEAEAVFERALGRPIHFINDADAAGYAEARYGAARDVPGLVILTTLGTGIGSALLHDGVLVPNSELGHLEIGGEIAERGASNAARERDGLSWADWASRLQRYYSMLESLFSPALFVVGGGVSKAADSFLPLLSLSTPIVPARYRNNAGILGAAALAER